MPARGRKDIVDKDKEGLYHCCSRIVRQCYLCGEDARTGKNYDHRKDWVDRRMEFLSSVMAVEPVAHAVMDNHLHVILRIRPDLVEKWSDEEVARRWLSICPGTREIDTAAPPPPTQQQIDELAADKERLKICRERLCSLSWHQKFLKEHLARRANREDGAKGCFFASRFTSVRLLDIYSLILCALYVELNLVRAGMATTPETSKHTSAWYRIRSWRARNNKQGSRHQDIEAAAWLAPINEGAPPPDGAQAALGKRASDKGFLPFGEQEYFELLDWCGREVREGKRGKIPDSCKPILERLEVDPKHWTNTVLGFRKTYASVAGTPSALREHAAKKGRRWFKGVGFKSNSLDEPTPKG